MGRPNWCPSKSSRICSDHFVEEMFDRTGQFVRLCKHAFPTRFKSFTRYLIKVSYFLSLFKVNCRLE